MIIKTLNDFEKGWLCGQLLVLKKEKVAYAEVFQEKLTNEELHDLEFQISILDKAINELFLPKELLKGDK